MVGNIFSDIRAWHCNNGNILAAGTGDNTAVTGATIDRFVSVAQGNGDTALNAINSGKLVITAKATLTSSQTLSLAVEYQTSTDGSTWATAVSLRSTSALLSATGSTQLEYDLNLKSLPRYIRFNYTPDLSAGSTDTAVIAATFLGGDCSASPITRSA